MKSVRYVTVKVEVEHSVEIDPETAIEECDYRFQYDGTMGKIVDTEMIHIQEDHPL